MRLISHCLYAAYGAGPNRRHGSVLSRIGIRAMARLAGFATGNCHIDTHLNGREPRRTHHSNARRFPHRDPLFRQPIGSVNRYPTFPT